MIPKLIRQIRSISKVGAPVTRSTILTTRILVVLAVVTSFPLLALPPINRCVNGLLRDEAAAPGPRRAGSVATADVAAVADRAPSLVERPPLVTPDAPPRQDAPPREDEPARTAVIQEQLKQLGANYMVLEMLADGRQFRFQCRVEMPANAIYARVFEAVERQPLAAMEQVLAEVRQWHHGQPASFPQRARTAREAELPRR